MREILFRGKRTDNGRWVEGYLIADTEFAGKPYYHTYIVNYKSPSGCFGGDIFIEVIPETVGQYTGLTDKNGTKIFEGDILHRAYHPAEDLIVEWNDGSYNFLQRIHPRWGYQSLCCTQNAVEHLKVIGNIHDDPELLDGAGNG